MQSRRSAGHSLNGSRVLLRKHPRRIIPLSRQMRKSLRENQNLVSEKVNRPLVIAHRGASGLAPENTLAAFKLAVALGAQGVELDVHLSADGLPVVIHDRRLKRTTGGIGQVAKRSAAELQKLDAGNWFLRKLSLRPRNRKLIEGLMAEYGQSPEATGKSANLKIDFSAQRVPTLEEVFALLAPAQLSRIYVELKGEATRRKALLEATLALLYRFELQSAVTLLSFDHQIIREARRLAPDLRTAATFPAAKNALATSRSMIRSLKGAAADEAALHFGLATRRTVAALHKQGFAVSVWTVNNKLVMRRLIASGVDAIMTNFPNRLTEVFETAESMKAK
jgi:glycerophosphoryl diester phosphodiesterase